MDRRPDPQTNRVLEQLSHALTTFLVRSNFLYCKFLVTPSLRAGSNEISKKRRGVL